MTIQELKFEIEKLEALGRTLEANKRMRDYIFMELEDHIAKLEAIASTEGYRSGHDAGCEDGLEYPDYK